MNSLLIELSWRISGQKLFTLGQNGEGDGGHVGYGGDCAGKASEE